MGARGSGRRGGLGLCVDKCHEHHSIDLAWLRRRKLLIPGRSSTLTWLRRGHRTGSINIACQSHAIRLTYKHRQGGSDWADVDELVPLLETATNFGGRRQWFECPGCRRQCRILYGGTYFRCRRCHRLRYETQYEPAFARAATRALKIRERLGDRGGGIDDPFPTKPKGMHGKTYARHLAEAERFHERWVSGFRSRYGWYIP